MTKKIETKTLKIAFFGSPWFSADILEQIYNQRELTLNQILKIEFENLSKLGVVKKYQVLVDKVSEKIGSSDFEVKIEPKLVVCQPDSVNRGKISSCAVAVIAKKLGIELWQPEKINHKIEEWNKMAGDLDLSVLVAYGQIISSKILQTPKYGFLNWHPSLLPKYRGATPMQSAIKNQDETTGLSWLNMTPKMDAGNVFLQVQHKLGLKDDFYSLSEQMKQIGLQTWGIAVAMKILGIAGVEQDDSQATFCGLLSKKDRLVDVGQLEASKVFAHFRAMIGFPGTSFIDDYFGSEVKLAEVVADNVFGLKIKEGEQFLNEVLFESSNWLQIKGAGGLETFLKCANQTRLRVKEVVLSDGKRVKFEGYQFKSKK